MANNIIPVDFSDALGERYFAYALSTITSRSLPDVRDGLKPVHRRLLFAMLQLRLDPKSGFKKCARVVGDVIGKYHPHGDTAVYDAMVRLAQSFSVRYPLVDGQGNFGSIDGDNPAAMRYTEARLTEIALELLADLDKDTVDFQPNYDGSESEPAVLPAAFPNLLANGSEGIAVGMATSIPPHNLGELCDALLYLIKSPNATISKLCSFVQGPDFPTGGIIVDTPAAIHQAYETGKGSFRVRAKWEKEELGMGMYNIVITEIPYQVQKSKLIEKIADAFKAKKLALLGNIRDESAEDIRIVLEPKSRTVDPEMLMESLYKLTDLEVRIQLNMNVLDKGITPKVMNLREVLRAFLEHKHDVLIRRSNHRLEQIKRRLEILEGLLIAYLNLDEIIRIIREEDEPKAKMMKKWKLTDVQAEAILNMRLRQLRKLEEIEIKTEHDALSKEKKAINALLKDEDLRWEAIGGEIKAVKEKFGQKTVLGKRRTQFSEAPISDVVSIEAFVEKEPITIFCSAMGWIRALRGHNIEAGEVKYKEGDDARFVVKGYTTDKLLVFATDGRFFTIGCDKLPGGKGHGEPVRLMVDLDQNHDICRMHIHKPGEKLIVASSDGYGFMVPEEEVLAQTKGGKQVLNVGKDDKAVACCKVDGDHVATIGTNRKLLVFPLSELPEMKRGKGVRLQKFKEASLSDIKTFTMVQGLSWQLGDRVRTEADMRLWLGTRAAAGKLPPTGFPRENKF
ncbi:MAG: DNA topoisomerase IV subunit A [Alphaproteobacteria bacterium]|nr:DNA topoisomerase IV subunit A [Alphaproteobacteria bacterium]